ncbi:MAG TPA: DUF2125 domain-containing protein [Devosiaceae bacterium]|jgi:hypothetical protein
MKRIIILGSVVFLVVVAWCGAWLFFAGQIKSTVESLAEADGITNPKITCGALSVAGFPFRFDLTCTDAQLVQEDLTANLAELRASVLVYQPTHALFFAKAPLTLSDAFTGSKQRLDWTDAELSGHLEGWRIGRISLHAENVAFNNAIPSDELIAKTSLMEVHLLDIPEQHDAAAGLAGLAIYAKADNLNAPGFQVNDGDLDFEAELTKVPDDVRQMLDADAVRRWQAAGGNLNLVTFHGADGDANFNAAGTLNLDAQMRTEGQVKLTSTGIVERFGAMIPAQIRPLILGNQAPDGSYAQTLTLRGGVILSGILPIGVIPPLF